MASPGKSVRSGTVPPAWWVQCPHTAGKNKGEGDGRAESPACKASRQTSKTQGTFISANRCARTNGIFFQMESIRETNEFSPALCQIHCTDKLLSLKWRKRGGWMLLAWSIWACWDLWRDNKKPQNRRIIGGENHGIVEYPELEGTYRHCSVQLPECQSPKSHTSQCFLNSGRFGAVTMVLRRFSAVPTEWYFSKVCSPNSFPVCSVLRNTGFSSGVGSQEWNCSSQL